MLDIRFIREHADLVQAACNQKKVPIKIVELLELDAQRIAKQQEVEQLLQQRKLAAAQKDQDAGRKIKSALAGLQTEQKELQGRFDTLLLQVPNIPTQDTPIGPDESGNQVLRQVGEPRKFEFKPKEHWELGIALDIIDNERAAKVAGSRFSYLKRDLVLLQSALVQYAWSVLLNRATLAELIKKNQLLVSDRPFIPVMPPIMILPEVYQKMARLEPREERYYLPSDDLYLIGSAEHTLGSMHMNESFEKKDLPLRYVGSSVALRREAGTYGKDMKGILRLHQFDKLEMESFTTSDQGLAEQDFFVAIQEYFMQELAIPYQVVAICTGDMGAPDARQIDIEAWMPGQNRYRETHTADYMTDYQARRLKTHVKSSGNKSEFVHMNDATAFAGRTMIAILENYQQADGSILIPKVLQPYMLQKKVISR